MKINKIELINFRKYEECKIEFNKGINLITGMNGVGKTNVVEAIDFLSIGKSFKTNNDEEMIKFKEKFARIEMEFEKDKSKKEYKAIISSSGKKIHFNEIELKKLSELSGNLLTVVFQPEDVLFFKDSPGVRRKFLDLNISGIFNEYMKELLKYKNLLKERNFALKEENVDLIYLETLEEQLCEPQFKIMNYRKKIIEELNENIEDVFNELDEKNKKVKLRYITFVKENEFDKYKDRVLKMYQQNREVDLKRKATSIGIHHDDIKMYLDEKEIGVYASQGQNRIGALSLKLSMFNVIKKYTDEDAIVILDDVLSELDEKHQIKLIAKLINFEQVFITCAKENIRIQNCTTYVIKENKVTRRM